ncbi:hypothetical protein Ade02nite_15100 [Paractinoplanes deccanensis]|uniref:Uncharacterized protein n=1 Tax=Paractinoplanes deccanensis TaxID=113561 RepID=A0ABQ3XYS9_9ACTN|nr:hypothetical protein [Actinoplanes deccanensis]GID72869.1 hypothetical protein Ade02nite_15100 [Actinoplanes deccanensis]
MVTLTIGRLHTRYAGDAVRFADSLPRMVDVELDRALDAVRVPEGHVCVRRLTVPVRLDRDTLTAARAWADQIAAALARAVADVGAEDVVVYRRTLDVLADMLAAAGRGDTRREWAWRQTGVLPPGPEAFAAAVAQRPDLACAALTAAARLGPLPLTAAGWVTIAHAVGEVAGPPPATGSQPEKPASVPTHPAALRLPAVLGHPVALRLPAAQIARRPAGERRAVARLVLLCAAPALSRSAPAIAAVAASLASPAETPPGTPLPEGVISPSSPEYASGIASPDGPPVLGPASSPPSAGASAVDAVPPLADGDPVAVAATTDLPVTAAGGVLFLIRAAEGSGVEAEGAGAGPFETLPEALADWPLSTVVAWVAARLGGVGADDPAVHLLAGSPAEPLAAPRPDEDAALAAVATRVEEWLRPLLRLEPGDDLGWLWRRTARIDAQPGWAEITFALDDVDTRVRAAGLDLDPGFVWWLGSVVRYRYV